MIKKYLVDKEGEPDKPYLLLEDIHYMSRYGHEVYVPAGRRSDGATGAFDIISNSWWIHDELCNNGCFQDAFICTNLMASTVLSDVLKSEGRWIRARYWFLFTLALGGGEARDNGLF